MRSLILSSALYALGLAAVLGFVAVTGRQRSRTIDAALTVCSVAAAAVSVTALARLAHGHRPAELATHLGYVVTAPLLLPASIGVMHGDRGRWANAGLATACLVLVVVLWRVVVTQHG